MATPWINQPTAPSPDRCVLFCAAIFLNHSVSRTTPWFGPDPRAYVWPPSHPRTPHPRCAPSLFPPVAPVHTHGSPHACQHARIMTRARTSLPPPRPSPFASCSARRLIYQLHPRPPLLLPPAAYMGKHLQGLSSARWIGFSCK